MPVLLLLPLVVVGIVALWFVLLPVSLRARYRAGRTRRPARAWLVGANAWLAAVGTAVFLASSWIAGHWIAPALPDACIGLLAGAALGIVGLWLTRFDEDAAGLHYTPSRWMSLLLTLVVAARIAAGLWWTWPGTHGVGALRGGSLFGIGGLLLGYAFAYTWTLRARLARRRGTLA